MSVLSLKSVISEMNDRLMSGSENSYNQLTNLREKLQVLYDYRNDIRRDIDTGTDDNTPKAIQNICTQHYYSSFEKYLESQNLPITSLSIGDIHNAVQQISYCSCNSRNIDNCKNVVTTTINGTQILCQCNLRNPVTCTCQSRTGGKYDPLCNCDTRYAGCSCVERSALAVCECNGRCSCNAVNEYTMTPPPDKNDEGVKCLCESRDYDNGCQCFVRTITPISPCDCQARTATCNGVGNAPNGWDKYCGSHTRPTTQGQCTCNYRDTTTAVDYCDCYNRTAAELCQCNLRSY